MAATEVDPAPRGDDGATDSESLAPAVTRAAGILHLLAENDGMPAGPSELARRLGLPKSSIANISSALADTGLLRRVGTGFALGRRLAELGAPIWPPSTKSRSSTRPVTSCPPHPWRPFSWRSWMARR